MCASRMGTPLLERLRLVCDVWLDRKGRKLPRGWMEINTVEVGLGNYFVNKVSGEIAWTRRQLPSIISDSAQGLSNTPVPGAPSEASGGESKEGL